MIFPQSGHTSCTLLACSDEGVFGAPDESVDVFVVDTTGGREALMITSELRAAGLRADRAFENRSMKAQMKAADRSGAGIALIVGPDELANGTIAVRPLRQGGEQRVIVRDGYIALVQSLVAGNS